MKKILMSVLVIAVAVSIAAVGISGAWFSDIQESGGAESNILQTGIIELDAIGDIGTVEDLKPCETQYSSIVVHVNEDSNPGEGWLHIRNIESSSFDLTGGEEVCDPDGLINDIQDWMTLDLAMYWDGGGKWIIEVGDDTKLSCAECFWIPLGVLEPCEEYELRFSFHLQEEAGNCYQSDECQFDIEVLLQQIGAPAPEPEFPVGEMKTVRLENKVHSGTWPIIPDDGIYGVVNYWVGGDLHMKMIAKGLVPGALYQMKLQGPGGCTATDHRLARGVQGHTGTFDAGYWTGSGPLQTTCSGVGIGIYNFGYECADANGEITKTFVIKTGLANPWPALPSGTYKNVEVLVVRVQPHPGCVEPIMLPWPGTYTGILMGTGVNLDFTIP
jgi:hypothetical protein